MIGIERQSGVAAKGIPSCLPKRVYAHFPVFGLGRDPIIKPSPDAAIRRRAYCINKITKLLLIVLVSLGGLQIGKRLGQTTINRRAV